MKKKEKGKENITVKKGGEGNITVKKKEEVGTLQ